MGSNFDKWKSEYEQNHPVSKQGQFFDEWKDKYVKRYDPNAKIDHGYINQYLSDHHNYWSGYGAGDDPTDYRLKERRAAIDSWLSGSLADGTIDQKWYDQVEGLLSQADSSVGMYQGQRDAGTYMNDWREWYNQSADALDGMDWSTGRGGGAFIDEALAGFADRDAATRAWLEENRAMLGEEYYKSMLEELDSYGGYADELRAAYDRNAEYFNQWDSREIYDIAQMSTDELKSEMIRAQEAGKPVAFTTKDGQNVTWQMLYDSKFAGEDLAKRLAEYSQNDDWEEMSQGISKQSDTDSDYTIIYSLAQSSVPYDWETAEAYGYTLEEFEAEDQRRRYIESKYGVDLHSGGAEANMTLRDLLLETDPGVSKEKDTFDDFRYLSEDELKVLNYIYNTQGREAALEWHEGREWIYENEAIKAITQEGQLYGAEHPLWGTLWHVGANIGGGVEQIVNMADYLKTGELHQNRTAARAAALTAGTSDRVDWNIGNFDAFDFVYQTAVSGVDSYANAQIFGPAAEVMLGLSAAASATNDAINRGASNSQAFWTGITAGTFEAIFEHASIENLRGMKAVASAKGKDIALNIAKSMLTNASEETLTEVANVVYDLIANGDFSQYETTIRQYQTMGLEPKEAKRKAAIDLGLQVLESGSSGALMGLGFGVAGQTGPIIGNTIDAAYYSRLPKDVRNSVKRLRGFGMDKGAATELSIALYQGAEGYGDQAAAYMAAFDPKQDPYTYASDFRQAYEIGRNNGNREYIGKTGLTQAQGEVAYKLGQEAGKKKAAAPEERPDTQTEYTVSDDGKTVDVKTGKAVEVKGFKSVGKNAVLETKDGSISAQDVSFGTEDEAVVYEVIGRTIGSANMANNVLKAYAEAVKGGMSASDFAAGLQQAYDLGFKGQVAERQLGTYELAGALPVGVRGAAFNQGKRMGDIRTAARDAAVRKQGRKAKGDRQGTFHFERKGRTFSKKQEASLSAMEALSKALGVDIYVYESYEKGGKRVYQDRAGAEKKAPNGYYDEQGIHIDLNAGNLGQGTMMFTVAHELTHFIKEWSPVKFRKLADLLVGRYAEQGTSVRDLIDAQILKAKENGREIDRDTAFEEVVADSMEVMLTQGDMSKFMAQLQQKDKTLWEKVRDWFKDLAEKLQAVADSYKGAALESPEGRLVAQMDDFISVLQEAYAEALADAAGSYRASEGNKKTTRKGGVKYSFAGIRSRTADKSAYMLAKEMQEQGVDNEKIRQATGWYQGMDGKWRYEIDDSRMEITKDVYTYMRLGDLMKHEELYDAYPDLADIDVVFQHLGEGVSGSYNSKFDSIDLDYRLKNDPEGIKDALAHELQHAIQGREGFTRGSTVAAWERKKKQGFDARRAEDIRKAQETERELRRLQEEEPGFYRDMLELDSMTPDVPRGEVDWETLEKIEDDPIEWQQYDARREELEAKYGDMKVWDANDLLYERKQAAKNMGRSATELYFDTAGEVEARDVTNRRRKTHEQRKAYPPRLGNEDTVFSDGQNRSDDFVPGTVSQKEIEENISSIARMDPVTVIRSDEFKMGDGKLLEDVTAFFNAIGGSVYNDRLGDVFLRKRGVRNDLGHGMSDEKATSFAAVPDVLRYGKVAGFVINKGGKGFDSATVVAPITIGEVPYMMGVIVHRSNGENRFYVHDVFAIKEEAAPLITGAQRMGESGGATSTISIIRKILDVKQKSDGATVDNSELLRSDRDPTAAATAQALEKQNAKLREDVKELRELVRMQSKLTHGQEFRKSSIDAAVKSLAQEAMATLDAEDRKVLHGMLKDFYKFIAAGEDLSWDSVMEKAGEIADFLQERVNIKAERSEYQQDVLRYLRGQKIRLSDSQRAEVEKLYGYENFRKTLFGAGVYLSKDGMELDSLWHEAGGTDMFPGTFDPEVNEGDQPAELLSVIDAMREGDDSLAIEYAYNREYIRQGLIRSIYDSYWRVDNMNTVADRKQKEINEIRRQHNERMEALKASQQETVRELREKRRADLAKVREDYKNSTQKKVEAVREQYKAARARSDESRAAGRQRSVVEKAARDLMQMLSSPTKDAHVPLELQKPLEKFLASIDFSSKRALAGGEPTIRDVAYTRALHDVKQAIAAQRSAVNNEDGAFSLDVPADFIEMIGEHISVINKATEGLDLTTNRVYEMTSDELKDLAFILKTINSAIRQIDRLHMAGAKARVSELAKSTVLEMGSRKGTKTETGSVAMWANYTPTFAFERMGKAATQILNGLKQGQSKLARTAHAVIEFAGKTYTEKEVKAWSDEVHEVTLQSGKTVNMTTAQIMSFYCLSRRTQAKSHLAGGGIRIGNIGEGRKAVIQRDHYRLTQEDIANINGMLTDRQIEVANKLQRYIADVGGRLGNEISMARWDYMEMTDRDYFPIKSDSDIHDARNPDQDKANLWALLNKSFTKAVVKNANDAMVVSSIFDVFANHMSEMAEYNAFALPLVDAMKWYNYRETTKLEGDQIKTVGVKKALNDTLGTAAGKYFIDLMTDINSSQKGGRYENFFGKLLSRSKGASVGWNLRVAIQQPTAILRASVYVDPKSLAKGFTRFGHKKLGEEMLKYSGIALWKSMGYYDLNISRGITEQIKGDSTWLDKVNDAGMWLPGKMDQWTWTSIWAACKDKVQRETKLTGEELLQKTADVFDDLVYHTQVADSVLTRSSLMRSKSQTVKELTSFMAEPTMSANLLLSAFQDYREGVTKGEKAKRALRIAFCGYVLSGIANAFVTSFADAWQDDDEYESFWEKYGQALLGEKFIDGNLFAELNPLEKIVFVRDVLSLIQGYEGAKNPFVELAESGIKLLQNVSRFLKGEGSLTAYGLIYQGLQVLGSFTGAAPANLTREVVAIWNNTFGKWNDMMIHRYKSDERSSIRDAYMSGALSKKEAREALLAAGLEDAASVYWVLKEWDTGNSSKFTDLYDAALAGEDIADAVKELAENGKTEKEAMSQLKSQIGTWYYDPESETKIDRKQAEEMLRQYFDLDDDEIEELLDGWDMKKDTGFSLSDLKSKVLDEAVSSEDAVEYLVRYGGMEEDDARERVDEWAFEMEHGYSFDDIRQTYLDGEITADEARAVLMERAGKTEDDAEYSIELWDFEKENGWRYENRAALYKEGDITAEQLVDALIDVGEYDRKDAEYQVEVYDWEMDGLEGATVKRVKTWHEYCEKAGVTKEQFLKIQAFSANTKNDVGSDGKTINYSAMKKVMAEINKLPLSASQKDALAKAMGWSDKNIRKYKPW